jgi:hypothetical protein
MRPARKVDQLFRIHEINRLIGRKNSSAAGRKRDPARTAQATAYPHRCGAEKPRTASPAAESTSRPGD